MMYADSYMTKQEFEQMFDHTLYYEMRQKYDCLKAFPNIYEKVSKAARTGKQSKKEEFEEMFDHTLYYEMRQKYDCMKAFPSVYEKVNKAARAGK